jgi:uncharacterized protein (DUF305 family)
MRAGAALLIAAVLSSCTSAADQDRAAQPPSSAVVSTDVAAHNTEDVMFAQMMIPHHRQAIELAALVPGRSTSPELLALATRIAGEQQPEIDTMKALLLQWDADPSAGHGGHGGHGGMAGMVDEATMNRLMALSGPAFESLWLQSMISHHRGAIEMAETEIADGRSPDMITLAKNIVAAQQAEIDQMTQMAAN